MGLAFWCIFTVNNIFLFSKYLFCDDSLNEFILLLPAILTVILLYASATPHFQDKYEYDLVKYTIDEVN